MSAPACDVWQRHDHSLLWQYGGIAHVGLMQVHGLGKSLAAERGGCAAGLVLPTASCCCSAMPDAAEALLGIGWHARHCQAAARLMPGHCLPQCDGSKCCSGCLRCAGDRHREVCGGVHLTSEPLPVHGKGHTLPWTAVCSATWSLATVVLQLLASRCQHTLGTACHVSPFLHFRVHQHPCSTRGSWPHFPH